MAERKKRGLGRGLGALIPDAASNDRPVDVFFSGGDSEEGREAAEEPKAPRTARTDPAASMQSSRRRKPKTGASEATATKAPKANSSSAEETVKKTSGSTKKSTGSTASKSSGSTASKSAASTSKSAPTAPAKPKSTTGSTPAKAAPKAAKAETHSKPISTTKKTDNTKSAAATERASSSKTTSVSPESEAPSDGEVFESHPGVFTSSGDRVDDTRTKSESTPDKTINVVEDSSDSAEEVSSDQDSSSDMADTNDSAEESASSRSELVGVDSIPDTEYGEIDVELIEANPRQPRTFFDEDQLSELVHSIREIGVLQPVVVRQKPSDSTRFELIMGERRLRATKDAGLSTIPAIIRYVDDTDLLRDALLENLHRAELNPLEEAAAYGQLLEDFGCTQEELSERIGRSRPQISNTLRLLRLPPLVQRRVAAGVISAGHARAILGLREPEHMEVLAQRIVAEGMSVRASEEAVVLLNRGDSMNVSRATSRVAPQFIEVAERLGDRLDTKVNITVGKKKGKLSVEFANQDDLGRILTLLGVSSESD